MDRAEQHHGLSAVCRLQRADTLLGETSDDSRRRDRDVERPICRAISEDRPGLPDHLRRPDLYRPGQLHSVCARRQRHHPLELAHLDHRLRSVCRQRHRQRESAYRKRLEQGRTLRHDALQPRLASSGPRRRRRRKDAAPRDVASSTVTPPRGTHHHPHHPQLLLHRAGSLRSHQDRRRPPSTTGDARIR